MQNWEYFFYCSDICAKRPEFFQNEESDIKKIWANQPNSDVDRIQELGKKGWELVSVTPIVTSSTSHGGGGVTTQILCTFKRPIE